MLTKGNFTRDEWNHLLYCSTSAISVSIILKRCREERKKMQVKKRVAAKSMPMTNLVSRCRVRDPTVLASAASENPVRHQIWKSECSSELVKCAANKQGETCDAGSFIKLLRMEQWRQVSSQEWKSNEVLEARTERLASEQPARSFTQHTDRFVIDDDDMDSNTATESNFSLRSRSFLNRVNDRLRKM